MPGIPERLQQIIEGKDRHKNRGSWQTMAKFADISDDYTLPSRDFGAEKQFKTAHSDADAELKTALSQDVHMVRIARPD